MTARGSQSPPDAQAGNPSETVWSCHACGFEVGDRQILQCPECGAVQPRESVFDREARERSVSPGQNAMHCRSCRYELPTSIRVNRCPECGSRDVFLMGHQHGTLYSGIIATVVRRCWRGCKRLWSVVVG